MAWTYYKINRESFVGDLHLGNELFSIEQTRTQLEEGNCPLFRIPLSDSIFDFQSEEDLDDEPIEISYQHCKKIRTAETKKLFRDMDVVYTLSGESQVLKTRYDLELSKKRGLIRRVQTRIPKGNILNVICKCAGHGDSDDFLRFAEFVAVRFPKISQEIVNPQNKNAPEEMWDNLPYPGDFDWQNIQNNICHDFYETFLRSVEYCVVKPYKPFRIDPKKAREALKSVSKFKREPLKDIEKKDL